MSDEPRGYVFYGGPKDGQPVKHVSDALRPAAIIAKSDTSGHYKLDADTRRYVWTPGPLPYGKDKQ